jgi:uncharacterized protein
MLIGFAAAGVVAMVVHGVVGIVSAVLGWNLAKHGGDKALNSGRRRRRSNWDWGQFPRSSGGGWSTGGGGFSQGWGGFGGGSSGGGGASGGW